MRGLNEDQQLDRYYRDHVIGGTGAFVMTTGSYQDFASAIMRKLIREIAGSPLALLRHQELPLLSTPSGAESPEFRAAEAPAEHAPQR